MGGAQSGAAETELIVVIDGRAYWRYAPPSERGDRRRVAVVIRLCASRRPVI